MYERKSVGAAAPWWARELCALIEENTVLKIENEALKQALRAGGVEGNRESHIIVVANDEAIINIGAEVAGCGE